jgi:hypothetical protein
MGSSNTTPFQELDDAKRREQPLAVSVYGNIPQFEKSMVEFITQAKLMEDMFFKNTGKPTSSLMEMAPWHKFDISPIAIERSTKIHRQFNYLFVIRSILESYF